MSSHCRTFPAFAVGALLLAVASGLANDLPPPVAEGIVTDTFGRVVMTAEKQQVPCPEQSSRTAVILTIGQSNAANYASHAYQSIHGSAVLNFFGGKCYIASSPLLGADGPWGEYWTELGNRLVSSGVYSRVVLISSAIGGTQVRRWQAGGNLNFMLMDVLTEVRPYYQITHVLWHQGEGDYGTAANVYTHSFMTLVDRIRARGIRAPIYVCVTGGQPGTDTPVVQALRALPNPKKNIFAGVDTDALVTPDERNETGHFGPVAQEKVVAAWLQILTSHDSYYDRATQ